MNNLLKAKASLVFHLLIALCCLLPGCNNIFNTPKGATAADDGYGKIIIRFAGDEGRTVFPELGKEYLEYVYTFTRYDALTGGDEIESLALEPGAGGVFTVEVGFWSVFVEVYAGEIDADKLVAEGASEIKYIGSGPAEQLTVTLEEILEDAEDGIFSYTIIYPDTTDIVAFTLEKLPFPGVNVTMNPEEPEDLRRGQDGIGETLDVPAGFYLLTIQLTFGGKYTGTNEVIHIYPYLETVYEKKFITDDFLDAAVTYRDIHGVTPPAYGETPVAVITETPQYTGTVEWLADTTPFSESEFEANTVYTAVITLTSKPGYPFIGVAENFFAVAGADTVTNRPHTGLVTAVFPETGAAPPVVVSEKDIPGIVVPVIGLAPVSGELVDTDQYTGIVEWNPAHAIFLADTIYTATITLTAKPGYTFTGVAENFFTIAGASTTNDADSGIVKAKFIHTVTFRDTFLGRDITYSTVYMPHGKPVIKPADPELAEYKFAGWFIDDDCNEEGAILNRWRFNLYPATEDITLYARWLAGTYEELDEEALLDIFQNPEADPDLTGEFFLTDDIDLEEFLNGPDADEHGWMPIGFSEGDHDFTNPFMGTFDGNGCVISYLVSNRLDQGFIGLFGAIRNATIRNLGLIVEGIEGDNDVGGITGNSKSSLIENCFVKGDITARNSAGTITGHIGEGTIVRNCYTTGTVTSLGGDAGGITANIIDGGIIENCYSTMTITAPQRVGGIVAWVRDRGFPVNHSQYTPQEEKFYDVNYETIIRNCVAINDGLVLVPDPYSRPQYFGRIVGHLEAHVPDPYVPFSEGSQDAQGRPNGVDKYGKYRTLEMDNNYALNTLPLANTAARPHFDDEYYDGINVPDTDLRTQSFYEGIRWLFGNDDDKPWKMPKDGSYPILYWEKD